jgi:hypothetical protein
MTVVRRAPDLDRRVSSLPSPQESSSFAGPEYLSNGDSHHRAPSHERHLDTIERR